MRWRAANALDRRRFCRTICVRRSGVRRSASEQPGQPAYATPSVDTGTLADASGISSAAFAGFAEQKHLDGLIDEIDKLVPKTGYWPVKTTGTSETTNFFLAMGG